MKNRKRGFSLVELLIVLAVIAALIATITPVALNAIRKAQATKVAQNIKTLASALENAAYVNGVSGNTISEVSTIGKLGRDIDEGNYGVWYGHVGEGKFRVSVFTKEAVDFTTSKSVLGDLTKTLPSAYLTGTTPTKLGLDTETGFNFGYNFEFIVY